MSMKAFKKVLVVASALALSGLLLAGCSSSASSSTSEQQANRNYMAQVNQAMDAVNTSLADFDQVASNGDIASMKSKAQSAAEAVEKLKSIEAPDAMQDLQSDYSEGCEKLEEALNAYIDLYQSIANATDEHPFDYSTYDEKVKTIQDTYNEGLNKLKAADDEALKLNE